MRCYFCGNENAVLAIKKPLAYGHKLSDYEWYHRDCLLQQQKKEKEREKEEKNG